MDSLEYTNDIESVVLQRMSALTRKQAQELWTKPVPELKYLIEGNVARYRLIMRYFYENYSKLKYWLKPEEVYAGVMQWGLLPKYTEQECQRDLESLTGWSNLTSRHDGGRSMSIDEYLRKRFRYQMTPYSIEIERMLASLEQMRGFGGSLEPTLLERLYGYVVQIRDKAGVFAPDEALVMWRDVQGSFRQLHENASDYLASLASGKAEELMQTAQFLIYKDTLSHYLRNFIMGLQQFGGQLEGMLHAVDSAVWEDFLHAVAADEGRMPMLDEPMTDVERLDRKREEWQVFVHWFAGDGNNASDVTFLERATKDTIARMVRYALAIQERQRLGVSRKRELDYLGKWFFELESVEDAHRLAAYTFGLYHGRHFQGGEEATSDSADMSLWDELPMVRILRSRSRIQRRRGETESIRDRSRDQKQAVAEILAGKAQEREIVQAFLRRGSFSMSELSYLGTLERVTLLGWISRCMQNPSRTTRTPDGVRIALYMPQDGGRTQVNFEDGQLDLPDFRIEVTEVVGK